MKRFLVIALLSVLGLGVIGVVAMRRVFVSVTVSGDAMAPTLADGDRALGLRIDGSAEPLERLEVVGFYTPPDQSRSFVGRVIGLPGERVEIENGRVSIDGRVLDEPYVVAASRSSRSIEPLTVPADSYFIMGDNRRSSMDSRSYGPVPASSVWVRVQKPWGW